MSDNNYRTIYFTVPKSCTLSIRANGLHPKTNDGSIELLPFLRGSIVEPKVTQGHTDYLKVEIALDDKKFIQTNARDFEYHGSIDRDQIVAIASPPKTYMDVITLYAFNQPRVCGKDIKHPDFEAAYDYKTVRENV